MSETAKDKVNNAEVQEIKPPGEVLRGAVICGSAHKAHRKDMDKAHWLDQDESATGLFIKPGEADKSGCKSGRLSVLVRSEQPDFRAHIK